MRRRDSSKVRSVVSASAMESMSVGSNWVRNGSDRAGVVNARGRSEAGRSHMPEEPSPAGGREWEQVAEGSAWRREPPSPQPSPGGRGRYWPAQRGGANYPHPDPLPGGEGDTGRLSSYAIPLGRPGIQTKAGVHL